MDMNKIMNGRPRIAVLDPNTLAVLGLKNILQNVLILSCLVSILYV